MSLQGWQMEYRNELDHDIMVKWLVTKLGNFYVDIELPDGSAHQEDYTLIRAHEHDLIPLKPE